MNYEDLPGLRWSSLKHMATSPRYYRLRMTEPEPDTPSFLLGRAIHRAVLMTDWTDRFIEQPDFGDLRTKAAKEARNKWLANLPPGVEVLRAEQYATVKACVEAMREHPIAAGMIGTCRTEVVAQWQIDGIACKGRLDILEPQTVVDVKTTCKPGLDLITRSLTYYHYHGQLAWYHDGARAAGLIPEDAPNPWLIAVQTVGAHDVVCYQTTRDRLEHGRKLYRRLLGDLRACMATDRWPGMAPDTVPWDVSSWESRAMEIEEFEQNVEGW